MNYKYENNLNGTITLANNIDQNSEILSDRSLYKLFFTLEGNITINIDHVDYTLEPYRILALSPYQHILLPRIDQDYYMIAFNSNFYCIYGHDSEVSCGGLLFNGSGDMPILQINDDEKELFKSLIEGIASEFNMKDTLQEEMMRILLKRLIILCTRKVRGLKHITDENLKSFDLIRQFYILVDANFKEKKQVKEYADMLNRSPKTISRIFAACGEPTPLQVIHERIATEAKRLILYTDKSAKEIAWILGFEDLSVFSRFFKSATNTSLSEFRKLHIHSH